MSSASSGSKSEGLSQLKPLHLSQIRHLVFQGGSVKGTAYGGAVGGLEMAFQKAGLNLSVQVENIAGTSAGAITALALSMGIDVQELVNIIGNTDFKSFLDTKAYEIVSNISSDTSSAPAKTSAAMNSIPLLTTSFGLATGQNILDFLEAFVQDKSGISNLTFEELHNMVLEDREWIKMGKKTKGVRRDLFVVAYNLSLDAPKVFSYLESPTTIISDAVRCSMAIPYVFTPHKNYIKKQKENGLDFVRVEASNDLYIDGGITDNYPIWVFDKIFNAPYEATLGFYLVNAEEKREIEIGRVPELHATERREIKNILEYTKCVIETVISSQQTSAHKLSKDIERTVYIDHLGTNMMNFGLTIEEKNDLVASGWNCAVQRCGLLDEIGQCALQIAVPEQDNNLSSKDKKKKDKRDKKEKELELSSKKVDLSGSSPPSPDLDSATDTSPSPVKCSIV